MDIVVVESPAKAKTINKYLGKDYKVLASYGHVRDLPAKDGSVDPEHGFRMKWQVDPKSAKHLKEIAQAIEKGDRLILATDPDREGEAISWHVLDVLKKRKALKDKPVERVVFHEITKRAIEEAIRHPRAIDEKLVEAYLARRALDYLVGFTLSPVLWRKLPGARSAGRVQSVALRLVCEREVEIERFEPREYWTVEAELLSAAGQLFRARLARLDGETLKKFDLDSEEKAHRAAERVAEGLFTVEKVDVRPTRRRPPPPFTTSTLQQEAARKLGFSAKHTMRIAQNLYEGKTVHGETMGLITYMRTDSVALAGEAVQAIRGLVKSRFGEAYLPARPNVFKARAKNAQEAHEAIRPTNPALHPADVRAFLSEDEAKLYELIWRRAVACQMAPAEIEQTAATLVSTGGDMALKATGSVIRFEGFLKLYEEGRDEPANENEKADRLPKLTPGERAEVKRAIPERHVTKPPPRYTEASLVKKLEELGIGRPSTYASILSVLQERNYVRLEKKRFVPEDKGRLVVAFLESFFDRYVEYDFTAHLEEELDEISRGEREWKAVLEEFWKDFSHRTDEVMKIRTAEILDRLNQYLAPMIFPPREDGSDPRRCPECGEGKLSLKVGRYGAFIGCSRYPECRYTRPFSEANGDKDASAEGAEDKAGNGERLLGHDPETGAPIRLKSGRFGPYVEREAAGGEEKPARASLPKGKAVDEVDLGYALKLLSLPRRIGTHSETGEPVLAGIGRYGPYVQHGRTYANLGDVDEVFEVGMNRALALLEERERTRKAKGGEVLKELGPHPDTGEPLRILAGRYGPYVRHGKVNASLPKGRAIEEVTREEALLLLKAREEKMKSGKPSGRSKKAAGRSRT
ncbi:MAG: type I DNA topoisomerase [Alphaproteobacteria bacterium]|nr:MAG: type I DNA topoisomerase [Alphaproteobacteria bacterium]